ncbi:hypothetical protein ACWECC_22715, partial [Streptomyces microflavus]
MSPSSTAIRRTVEAYLGRHPGERDALTGLLAALDRPVEVTARTTLPGHVTCSAVVIDRQGRVLHIRHRASGGFMLTPGDHARQRSAGDRPFTGDVGAQGLAQVPPQLASHQRLTAALSRAALSF